MPENAVELVRLRNNFYRDNYRRVVTALLLCLLTIIVLIGIIFYMITHRPAPKYFATTSDGQIIPLIPLDRPNLANNTIAQWANEAATTAYTLDFQGYRKQLLDASNYFTPNGWKQFLQAMEASNNLESIKAKQLLMTAVPTGTPSIVHQGMIDGRYSWSVQIPLLVSLQNANTLVQQSILVTMLITRVSVLDNSKGIAIAQFIASQQAGPGPQPQQATGA